jgi:hypothetical protein
MHQIQNTLIDLLATRLETWDEVPETKKVHTSPAKPIYNLTRSVANPPLPFIRTVGTKSRLLDTRNTFSVNSGSLACSLPSAVGEFARYIARAVCAAGVAGCTAEGGP